MDADSKSMVEQAPEWTPTIHLSPELRDLFKAIRSVKVASINSVVPGVQEATESKSASSGPPVTDGVPDIVEGLCTHSAILRRDGLRPLFFRGQLLTSLAVRTRWRATLPDIEQRLSLYISETGEVIASAELAMPEGGPGWSRHRAARIDSADAMTELVQSLDPASAFPQSLSDDFAETDLVRNLRSDLIELLRATCRPVCTP